MKLRKAIQRILALGTGATMFGATVLSATAAADLANFPAPFVEDGKFNALIVVGDEAASSDVIGSVDVATSLQFASRVQRTVSTSGGSAVSLSGDSWKVGTSSKVLELSENRKTGAPANQEVFRDILTFIDESELNALADGTFENDKGSFGYNQFVHFDDGLSGYVLYTEDDDNVVGDFLYFPSGRNIARYELEFTTSSESDVTDTSGSLDTTGTRLWSYENEDLTMLGTPYSVVKAERTGDKWKVAKLTLMGGAIRDILDEGETKTYTIDGKDYDVTLDFVGTTTAKFNVNGEVTDSITEGSTDRLSDDTEIGIRDILAQEFAGGVRKVEFYFGAQKVVLWDTDVTDTASSKDLDVGDETIDDAHVVIEGSDDNTTFKIDSIQINITADDDFYVPAGGKLTSLMSEPQAFLDSWDIEYHGIAEVTTNKVKVKTKGSSKYEIQFVDWNGNVANLPFVYTSGGEFLLLGDNDDDLVLDETVSISKDDYFVVSDGSQEEGERPTFALRYRGADKVTDDAKVMKFDDVGSGARIEKTYTQSGANYKATLKMGGATFNVWNATTVDADDFAVFVDFNGDDAGLPVDTAYVSINSQNGAKIQILNTSSTIQGYNVSVSVPDTDDYETLVPAEIGLNVTASGGEVRFSQQHELNLQTPEDLDNTEFGYTSMGAFLTIDSPTNDPNTLDIDYPSAQALPQVFLTAGATAASTSTTAEGDVIYYETTPIEVGSAKLASEVSDIRAQHAILVGGPCANSAAADVMGNPANCAEGFEDGKALLKLFEHANGNVALLVAGFSAMDTRRAARVLANHETYQESGDLQGTEVEVVGTSFTDISVQPPAVAVPVEEEAAADEEATE